MGTKTSVADTISQRVGFTMNYDHSSAIACVGQLTSPISPRERLGMMIRKVTYWLNDSVQDLIITSGTFFRFGLSMLARTPDIGGFTVGDKGIVDWNEYSLDIYGAGTLIAPSKTVVKDFTNLPAGGLVAHPAFLYWFTGTFGVIAGSAAMRAEILYNIIPIDDTMWEELWQVAALGGIIG